VPSEQAHTWTLDWHHRHTDDACIATVEPGFTEETKANIRLIAAAPDLLAALEGVVETPLGERPTASALLAARAALAKAGGAK